MLFALLRAVNWGPITYLIGIWAVMWLLGRGGRCVYHCMLLAGWLTAIGAVLRCVPALMRVQSGQPSAYPLLWLHAGSFVNGFSGPAVSGSCSAVAACWFAPSERTLATSIAYGVCALGPAVGFALAMYVRSTVDFERLLHVEAGASLAAAALWTITPPLPATAPSPSAGRRSAQMQAVGRDRRSPLKKDALPGTRGNQATLLEDCKRVSGNCSFMRLVASGGISFGIFQCKYLGAADCSISWSS
eukprot:SAG31_NODE_47_length_30979_cov_41.708841_21_plen_245_part_00